MAEERVIGVLGSGTMGAGIAHALADHGYQVICVDTEPDLVRRAVAGIRERLDQRIARGRMSAYHRDEMVRRLRVGERLEQLKEADFIIEAVLEDLEVKRRLLRQLDEICPPRTILASNTSSLSITAIAEPLKNPQRVIGMHFFNPAPVMPLVEVIAGARTDNQAVVQTVGLARALEKTPVKAKDRPGFIANRVARPFYLEALWLLGQGYGDVPTIDAALRSAGFPMGPFELLDLIGLDINLAVTKSVHAGFDCPPRFAPNDIQEKLVADGRLGRKSGRGFYEYSGDSSTPAYETPAKGVAADRLTHPAFKAFAAALDRPADAATYLYSRIITAIINEGAVTVGEETSLARDVDLAMTLGFNYPEGPMTTADRVGLDLVLNVMRAFESDSPAGRHTPAPLLLEKVAGGELGEKSAAGFLWHSL